MGKTADRFAVVLLLTLLAASSHAQGQERFRLAYSAISGSMRAGPLPRPRLSATTAWLD